MKENKKSRFHPPKVTAPCTEGSNISLLTSILLIAVREAEQSEGEDENL